MTTSRRGVLQAAAILASQVVRPNAVFAGPPRLDRQGWRMPEPQGFRTVENVYLTLKDGTRIGVRLWLPESSAQKPAPVVLNYIPYRKRDVDRARDDLRGPSLARNGIAYARADMRGSGASDGVLVDEYLQLEQDDALEIIAWLAAQPWSNGSVGMTGISWGGFSAVQAAALAPPALKAIMPMCFTVSRFTDDAHYIGGALGLTNFQWGVMMKGVMAAPPDPEVFGPGWRDEWMRRLDATPPILARWTAHQRFDAYWRHASVAFDYDRIKCPVYCVGGWIDAYNNSIVRCMENLKVPRKALIGPWTHTEPSQAHPLPALDWTFEEVRWWKHWLAGEQTGLMDEPMIRTYMPYRTASEVWPAETPGRWIADMAWPSPRVAMRPFHLQPGRLTDTPGSNSALTYRADTVVGTTRIEWLPFDMARDLPGDQAAEDRKSLLFDSAPIEEDIEILGNPVLRVRVSSDQPVAKLAVRLNEVNPNGASWEITYGLLNLTHRSSHQHPSALVPGEFYEVDVPMNLIAHRFKAGNRIRLAISENLWPLVWPSPRIVTLTIATGSSRLMLPVRAPEEQPAPFPIPIIHQGTAGAGSTTGAKSAVGDSHQGAGPPVQLSGPGADGRITIDKQWSDGPTLIEATGAKVCFGWRNLQLAINADDPGSSVWTGDFVSQFERADWGQILIRASFKLTSTATAYHVKEALTVTDGEKQVFERHSDTHIPRDLT